MPSWLPPPNSMKGRPAAPCNNSSTTAEPSASGRTEPPAITASARPRWLGVTEVTTLS